LSVLSRPSARWVRRSVFIAAATVTIIAGTMSSSSAATHNNSLIAVTDKGFVRGTEVNDVRQFRGIPYAAPPTGDNRWRPPQPAARWQGIRDASEFAPHCAQLGGAFGLASDSEDCLFLNVFMPKLALQELPFAPVMVWIHGGALVTGLSDVYDPSPLVAKGVVVVTINYRLGALGFLAHPAFAAESAQGAAGNYGLLDQQAALQWVQKNIRHFGGDPHNVTIFGESAGGLSVHTQLASPLADGLFDKAIVESGAYQPTQPSLTAAETSGSNFATAAGCADQSATCLRGLPVATILAKQTGGVEAPTVDGFFLKQSITDAFTSGNFNKVPVIEGSNHDEWRLFVAQTEAVTHVPLSAAGYPGAVARLVGPTNAAALLPQYPAANFNSPSEALGALGTDAIFACNARKLTSALAASTKVYQYEFNDPNAPVQFFTGISFPMGAYHASEIQYLFGSFGRPRPAMTDDQTKLSQTMVRYWTQFAWFSNPNTFVTPFWPRFDATKLQDQALVPGTSFTDTNFTTDHKCSLFGIPATT
jgi:para-nitrobenzyl esterase